MVRLCCNVPAQPYACFNTASFQTFFDLSVICPGFSHLVFQSSWAFATNTLTKNNRIMWVAGYHYTGIEPSRELYSAPSLEYISVDLQRPPPPNWVEALTDGQDFFLRRLERVDGYDKPLIFSLGAFGEDANRTVFPDCVSYLPYSLSHNVFQCNSFGPSAWPRTDNFSCASIRCQYIQSPSQQGIFLHLSIVMLWWIESWIVHLWSVSSQAIEELIVTDHVWLYD